ncbi:CBX5 [Mytilus coruscus]|uniref:CBX5 n=1 Tax=Mytilus coruscus TaxID=42192 RepID=A0A6J8CR58_MYTCO|nr:CBX5 [Mytilus coruscus]
MDPTKILAKFKGDFTENSSRWWKLFENFVNLYWDESKFCNAFPYFLKKMPKIWFNGLPEDVTDTRENLKCEFLKKYQISHGQNFQKLSDFIDLKQQETESVAEYINRVNALSEDQDVGQFKLTKLQYKCKPELVRLMSLELKPKIDMMFQQISAVNSKSLQQPTASPPMVEPLLDDRKAKVQHRIRTPRRQRRRNPCYRCGTANGNADALSRRPYGTEIVTITTTATVESSTQTEATFIELDPYASICEITTSPKEKNPRLNDPIRNDTQVQRHTNDDRNNDDSDLYLVERIVNAKRINNKMHYYIKWLGFGNRSNSWEPEENIPPELRHEFKVRMDQTKRIKARKTKR